jgi:hypothetical protein
MPVETIQTNPQRRGARCDALRDAALAAGVSLDRLLRARSVWCIPRPILAGVGLIAVGTVVVLIYLGADLHVGLAGGQSGLLPSLVQAASAEEPQLATLRCERDDAA